MEKDPDKIIQELREDVSAFVELKLELLKLNTYERTGKVIAVLSYGLVLLFLAFFAILFIFLALGFFLGEWIGFTGAGFALVAVLYLLLMALFFINYFNSNYTSTNLNNHILYLCSLIIPQDFALYIKASQKIPNLS